MKFTLYTADCSGNEQNCQYPHEVHVDSADSLSAAAAKDHVCASFKDNHRSVADFMACDVITSKVIPSNRMFSIITLLPWHHQSLHGISRYGTGAPYPFPELAPWSAPWPALCQTARSRPPWPL